MPKYNLTWHETDARLLEALLLATADESGATLQDVLLMADAVDGTVFTLPEVEEALEKLVAGSVVHIRKNKLLLAPEFLQAYAPIAGAANEPEQLLQLLQTHPLTEQSITTARDILKKYKLKNHYQQYMEQFG
nr:hypothetical protein [Pontibacter liquoris]